MFKIIKSEPNPEGVIIHTVELIDSANAPTTIDQCHILSRRLLNFHIEMFVPAPLGNELWVYSTSDSVNSFKKYVHYSDYYYIKEYGLGRVRCGFDHYKKGKRHELHSAVNNSECIFVFSLPLNSR